MPKLNRKAILTIIASFENVPPDHEIEDILDNIRAYGAVDKAVLQITTPAERDLVKEGL